MHTPDEHCPAPCARNVIIALRPSRKRCLSTGQLGRPRRGALGGRWEYVTRGVCVSRGAARARAQPPGARAPQPVLAPPAAGALPAVLSVQSTGVAGACPVGGPGARIPVRGPRPPLWGSCAGSPVAPVTPIARAPERQPALAYFGPLPRNAAALRALHRAGGRGAVPAAPRASQSESFSARREKLAGVGRAGGRPRAPRWRARGAGARRGRIKIAAARRGLTVKQRQWEWRYQGPTAVSKEDCTRHGSTPALAHTEGAGALARPAGAPRRCAAPGGAAPAAGMWAGAPARGLGRRGLRTGRAAARASRGKARARGAAARARISTSQPAGATSRPPRGRAPAAPAARAPAAGGAAAGRMWRPGGAQRPSSMGLGPAKWTCESLLGDGRGSLRGARRQVGGESVRGPRARRGRGRGPV